MHPRLIASGDFVLYTFGVFLAGAYLIALWWLMRSARNEGISPEKASSLGLWVIVGAIIGAKGLMVLRSLPDYLANPSEFWSLATIQSAGDFYGGFIGALIASMIFFSRNPEIPRWRMADICAPSIALGQAVGRVGCFMAGDDYGSPTSVPWAVVFRDPDAAAIGGAPLGVPIHPVQLYESLTCLLLFFFLVRLARRKRFEGEIILAYSFCYAVLRFMVEYLRGDVDRGFLFGGLLSTSQFIALIVVLACVPLYLKRSKERLA